jgi:hypothetical protein
MKAGIESSARAERVAATDELQPHENPSTLAAGRRHRRRRQQRVDRRLW